MRFQNVLTRYRRRPRSRGAAVVEFAVVLPLLMLILFGILEYGYIFFVQQTLTNAAREGCRISILQSTTNYAAPGGVNDRIAELMSTAGLGSGDYTVTKTPDPPNSITENVAVSITVPSSKVSITGFFKSQSFSELEGHCTMRKEGV